MINKRFLALLIMILTVVFFYAQNQATDKDQPVQSDEQVVAEGDFPLPVDPDLLTGKLANGITYYIKANHKPEKKAELRLIVDTGSIMEDDDQQGLAHFTEHMAFNGTKHFTKDELLKYLNSIGMGFAGGLNAGTSIDFTVYDLTTPTDNSEQLEKAFIILSDWANGITFDDKEIESERGVVIEEWRMRRGIWDRFSKAYMNALFKNSRYAERNPIGKIEVLQSFTPDTIKRFYQDWYRPDLQSVVVVGDFEPQMILTKVKQYFEDIPMPQNPRPRIQYEIAENNEPISAIFIDKELPISGVGIAWKANVEPVQTFMQMRDDLINELIESLFNARLDELSQKPNSPLNGARGGFNQLVAKTRMFGVSSQVNSNRNMEAFTELMTETERIRRFGFTVGEYERCLATMQKDWERQLAEKDKLESNDLVWKYVSARIGKQPLMNDEQEVAVKRLLLTTISLDEVNFNIPQLMTDKNIVLMMMGPEIEGYTYPTEKELLQVITDARNRELTAYIDSVSNEPLLSGTLQAGRIKKINTLYKSGIKRYELSNGIVVYAKKTDFKNDEILFSATSPGGYSLYKPEQLFSARNAPYIVTESGFGEFDAITLKKRLSGRIANVTPVVNLYDEGFTGNCSPKDLETLFQLIYAYGTAPRRSEDSFNTYITKLKTELENHIKNPASVFYDSLNAIVSNNNPYLMGTKANEVTNIKLDEAMKIYKDRFADFSDFTFFFVGSFDEKELRTYCKTYLANLPCFKRMETPRSVCKKSTDGIKDYNIYLGQDPKSIVWLQSQIQVALSQQEQDNLEAVMLVLNERLREYIREKLSGVYAIYAYQRVQTIVDPQYSINVFLYCAPDKAKELSDASIAILDSVKVGDFSDEDIQFVKATLSQQHKSETKQNNYWLQNMQDNLKNKLPIDSFMMRDKVIEGISKQGMSDCAQKLLQHNVNLKKVIMYPQQITEKQPSQIDNQLETEGQPTE